MRLPALPVLSARDATLNFEALQRRLTLVTTLPVTPKDEQEIDFLADAANSVVWRLKYRAASTSVYKWEFVGGSPVLATGGSVTTKGKEEKAMTGMSLTVPLTGDYVAGGGCNIVLVKAELTEGQAILRKNAVSTGVGMMIFTNAVAFSRVFAGFWPVKVTLAKADVMTLGGNQTTAAGEVEFNTGTLAITPVRVG